MTATQDNGANSNTAITEAPRMQPLQRAYVQDNGPISHLMDSGKFEHLLRIAKVMGASSVTPKHLRGDNQDQTMANCFRVVNQALRWEFDPFAVADETYVVHGRLGYQGKLVAAVVNSRAGLVGRLKATYAGEGPKLTVTISGQFKGEAEPRTVPLSIAQAKTANEMWTKDPEQKLFYSGVIKWARRHCPELILGVLSDDDVDIIVAKEKETVQSRAASIADRLKPEPSDPKPEQPSPQSPPEQTADRETLFDAFKSQIRAAGALQEPERSDRLAELRQDVEAEGEVLGDGKALLVEMIEGRKKGAK